MFDSLDIEVRDTVFDPASSSKVIYVRESGWKKPHTKVWLFLDGVDLPYVKSVTYTLHKTFPNPVRNVKRTISNPNCAHVIWTYGTFEVKVTIEDKSGRFHKRTHRLEYPTQFKDAERVDRR